MSERILSGVQPSGKLHLGNYFGAIRQHIRLQDAGDCFYFIADYHALTTLGAVQPDIALRAATLRDNVRGVALDYLALGLDPAKAAFFRQSDIPEVAELAWILATVTGMGLLERAHSFKDKTAQGIPSSVGLFTYPILMAADILIYRSNIVPVGEDQIQHLEMTRDMAGYFNNSFGREVFPMPRERLDAAAVVPGTDGRKMSKSYGNTIEIFAEGKPLQKTVMAVVTDSLPLEAPKDPTTCNVFALYRLLSSPEEQAAMADRYTGGNFGYGEAKKALLAKIDAFFAPFRDKRRELALRPDTVEDVLREGAKKAREEARITMAMVREAVGLLGSPVG